MDSNIIAPYLLRAYAWEVLKANTSMRESQYGGKVPLVPLGEEPDIKKYAKPYLVFAFSETSPNKVTARSAGNMAFVIRDTDVENLTRTANILARTFDRADESAKDVNEYTSTIEAFLGMRFGTIELSFVDVDDPAESDGGMSSAIVNIRYEYYANYENIVTSIAQWDADSQAYVKRT